MTESVLDRVTRFQNGLIASSTGGLFDGGDIEFAKLRREILSDPVLAKMSPTFVRRCGDIGQFWAFIKHERTTYKERRDLVWDAFRPLIDFLEADDRAAAGDESVSDSLKRFGADAVQRSWQKALARRATDPEGAITAARTLVESVCKHILDDAGVPYGDADFPKLWALTAEQLNLMPSQHEHDAFKRILGNCQAMVDGLANVRNRVGDAHGKGRNPVRPKPRHAELAVNLAGSMASFLLTTWIERNETRNA